MELNEAKEISTRLHQALLKIGGVKDDEGNIRELGLIDQLDGLLAKIDPHSINFINNQQKKAVIESLQKIDTLFQKQKSDIVDITDELLSSYKILANGMKQARIEQDANLKKELGEYLPKLLDPAYERLDEKIRVTKLELSAMKRSDLYLLMVFMGGMMTGAMLVMIIMMVA